jgi:hypothetical protein
MKDCKSWQMSMARTGPNPIKMTMNDGEERKRLTGKKCNATHRIRGGQQHVYEQATGVDGQV